MTEKESKKRPDFKKLLAIYHYIYPYRIAFSIGLLLLLISSFLLMAFPFVSGKLIDIASGKSDWFLQDINKIAWALLLILLVQSGFSYFRVILFAWVSERAMRDIRLTLYQKYMSMPMSFFDRNRTGDLMSRIGSDVSLLQDTISVTLAEFIRQVAILIIGLGMIFYTAPRLSLFMLAVFPIVIISAMIFGRFIRKISKKTQEKLAETNVIVEETLQAIHSVKSFANETYENNRYQAGLNDVVTMALKTARFRAGFVSFIIFALFGAIVLIMWYGATLVASGDMTVGELISFILYTTFIGGSIAGLGSEYGQVQKAVGATDKIMEIIQEKEEPVLNQMDQTIAFEGKLRFENITFSYPTRKEITAIENVNFEAEKGNIIALVGQSGAGKSTIAQLLMHFYEPDSGVIYFDDKPSKEYSLQTIRKNVGIVPQEVLLFGGTIRENIAYGRPGASFEEIVEAAQKAQAIGFIQQFPDGFETKVGERGIKLSGGQKQRVAIARAILKNPTILILDEATSSLDAESERDVQEALQQLMQNRTTVVIAHRLSTIRKANKILVMQQGKIVEIGNFNSLTEQDGYFNRLVQLSNTL